MKPNKEGYWVFRGEIVRVSETWKNRFVFHKFRDNIDYMVADTIDEDWGCEITMEPSIKKAKLISELERRISGDYQDKNTWARSGALFALEDLRDWVKNK